MDVKKLTVTKKRRQSFRCFLGVQVHLVVSTWHTFNWRFWGLGFY